MDVLCCNYTSSEDTGFGSRKSWPNLDCEVVTPKVKHNNNTISHETTLGSVLNLEIKTERLLEMATQDTEQPTFVDPLSNSSKASIVTPPSTNTSSKKILKSIYKVEKSIENIYTHGKALVSNDEKFLVCCCSDKIKIVDMSSGQVLRILSTEVSICSLMHNNHIDCSCESLSLFLYSFSSGNGSNRSYF